MRIVWVVVLGMVCVPGVGAQGMSAWPVVAPAAVGMDAGKLAAFDAEIAAGKFGNVDSLLILRHGKVAFDKKYARDYGTMYAAEAKTPGALNPLDPSGPYNYFNPWWHPYYRDGGKLHTQQSVTKTVTSAVIGVAVTRGDFPSLDTPVLKFFDESKVANVDARKRRLTLRNLITMTVGMKWEDDLPYSDPNNSSSLMEASGDWVKFFIDQPMVEEPGTRFYYNDGAPEALGYIFRKATGMDIEEYAAKYLFAPVGIKEWFWKRTPQGVADCEGGLYLDRHDVARLMVLFEHGGVWDGKQVEGAAWVKASLAPAVTVSEKTGVKYGYLWWLYPYGTEGKMAFGGSGFGGQFPVVVPEHDLVIVVNGWNMRNEHGLGSREAIARVVGAVVSQ